ncbi:MAG: hypothetical protein ABIG20_03695 [archaeon]
MKNTYNTQILDIIPSTVDEGKGRIIDGYVKLKINDIEFWAFALEDWRTGKWSLSMKGSNLSLKLSFLNLNIQASEKKIKQIVPIPNQKKPCDYIIYGEVVDKVPSSKLPDKYERLQVGCGFVVGGVSVAKNQFKIGDYIQAEGRLDAYRVKEADEL